MFIICELGEQLSSKFAEFSDALYQCDWHSFPNEAQKVLLALMMFAQEPVIVKGFANILCARESFKKVIQNKIFPIFKNSGIDDVFSFHL